MRAAIYVRVSDQSQVDGYSLSAQERLVLDYCKSRDWVPVRVYTEEGRSARYEAIRKRPVFQDLLTDITKGEIDTVVVHTLDRWARNLKVMLESLSMLGQHNVGFVSITENLDYTTPHGKLTTQMLGGMAEFFSDMLAVHTKKGIDERARQGRHLGSLPFGYEGCWEDRDGERIRRCDPEHPGGIHIIPEEGQAVLHLFREYATGTSTLSKLASRLNDNGFRTRNTKKLPDAEGNLVAEPRSFTTASVRGILHNAFYTGKVKHKKELHPGQHEAIVSEELFQQVEATLRKNSGRSRTLSSKPQREYLLKGIIYCAYCRMPMSSQTYHNGHRYYREQYGSRGAGECINRSGSIKCEVADEQIGLIVESVLLPDSWMDRLLARIQLKDEVTRVDKERRKLENRLKRLGQVYLDELLDYDDYKRQKRQLEDQLSSLVIPGIDSMQEAGKLLERLPELWRKANLTEKHKILTTMLEAVYLDCKEEKRIVAIKPKPAFKPLFLIALTKADSGVVLVRDDDENDPRSENGAVPIAGPSGPNNSETPTPQNDVGESNPCLWWRRGSLELPVQRAPWQWDRRSCLFHIRQTRVRSRVLKRKTVVIMCGTYVMVGVLRLELRVSTSRMWRATNRARPK